MNTGHVPKPARGKNSRRGKSKVHAPSWDHLAARISNDIPRVPKASDAFIHDLRVSTKELLALLELIREAISKEEYRSQRLRLRANAAVLALYRDPVTLEGSFDWLVQCAPKSCRAELKSELRGCLTPRKAISINIVRNCHRAINDVLFSLPWPKAPLVEVFECGHGRTYKKARNAWQCATESKCAEDLHRWRRWVKFLYLQLNLSSAGRKPLPGRGRKLKQLQKWLGEHHDLVNLRKILKRQCPASHDTFRKRANHIIDCRLRRLESKTLSLGAKLFKDERL